MPIYDNNGTVNAQIGKIWDNDGITNRQIGKIYDNDGTTNSPIFSAAIPTFLYQNGAPDGEFFTNMVGSNYSISTNDKGDVGGREFTEEDFSMSWHLSEKTTIYLRALATSCNNDGWSCCNQGISNYMDLSDVKTIKVKGSYQMSAFDINYKCFLECQINIGLKDNNDKWLEIVNKKMTATETAGSTYIFKDDTYEVEKDIQGTDLNLSNCRLVIRTYIYIRNNYSKIITGDGENFVESITCTAVQ